jgi:hypothetical protein
MMSDWIRGLDLQKSDLEIANELGAGGQGRVHELAGEQVGYVYKEYLSADINGSALTRLVTLPNMLTASERTCLMRQSAWPLARVFEGGAVKGFVMRRAPH